ncbi:hypothetical protein QL285_052928 [Trifolium repens]|nr:hypothetical protein QL285_052928 [Trifolium repens]
MVLYVENKKLQPRRGRAIPIPAQIPAQIQDQNPAQIPDQIPAQIQNPAPAQIPVRLEDTITLNQQQLSIPSNPESDEISVGFSEKQEEKQKSKPKKWSEEDKAKMIQLAAEKPNSKHADLAKPFPGRSNQLLLPKFKQAKDEIKIKDLEDENKVLKEKLLIAEAKIRRI